MAVVTNSETASIFFSFFSVSGLIGSVLMLLMFLIVCFGDVVRFKDLKSTVKELQKFEEFGEIQHVIRLDSTPESLLGSINIALLDERRNSVYIGDFDSTKSIKAFTKEGRFLRSIFEYYEPTINAYNKEGELVKKIVFSQHNKTELDAAWNKKPFTEESRIKIKDFMHRFIRLVPCRDRMLVFEKDAKFPFQTNMYSFSKGKEVVIFKGYNPIRYSYREKTLVFDDPVGHYSEGLLCSLEPDEYLMGIKDQYPKLKATPFKEDDNPLLVLVRPF